LAEPRLATFLTNNNNNNINNIILLYNMYKYISCVDDLMKNHPSIYDETSIIETNTSDNDIHPLIGGASKDFPTGGFPPIHLCDPTKKEISDKDIKKREYVSHKTTVTMKEIMEKRRDVEPFI